MTEKKKRNTPSADAIPRRYKSNLVPRCSVGVPEPVAQASEELRLAGLAAVEAFAQRRAAEVAAKAAPKLDSEAGIEAVRRGEDLPRALALTREQEADAARQREKAAKAIAERASIALERMIRQHRDGWLEAQRADAAERAQDALDAVDALTEALERLTQSAGVVATLQTTPDGKVIESARTFKPRTVGSDKGNLASHLLSELRESIHHTLPDALPTGEMTAEEEELQAQRRGMAQLARGGVYVGGGE